MCTSPRLFWRIIEGIFAFASILIGAAGLQLVYALRTGAFFTFDDFLIFSYTTKHGYWETITDFLKTGELYIPRRIIGYITGYLNMKVIYDLFGANPNAFIFWNHILHTANTLMLFAVIYLITRQKFNAFFAALLFNRFYLFNFFNIHEYLAVFFSLLTIILILKKPGKLLWPAITYILALLSKEYAAVLPLFIKYLKKANLNPIYIIAIVYVGLQILYFWGTGRGATNPEYAMSWDPGNIWSGFRQYIRWEYFLGLTLLPVFSRRFASWIILAISLISLFPALVLTGRHEAYYMYLPAMWLLIYIGLNMPKISWKTIPAAAVIVILMGGRQAFPIVTRQDYPNWQKVSIQNVVDRVEKEMTENPGQKNINVSDINIERDATAMLRYKMVNMFLPEPLKSNYEFEYDSNKRDIEVKSINK